MLVYGGVISIIWLEIQYVPEKNGHFEFTRKTYELILLFEKYTITVGFYANFAYPVPCSGFVWWVLPIEELLIVT